jgi:hypothetical protein
VPLSYWGTLAILSIWATARCFRLFGTLLACTLTIGLGLLLRGVSHNPGYGAWYDFVVTDSFANQQWAALAVESGILDPVPDGILYFNSRFVPAFVPLMQAERLSLFAKPKASWIGRDYREIFPGPLHAPVEGKIVRSERLETALTVAGWTNANLSNNRYLELVLMDENNRIVGFGKRLPAGLPMRFSKLNLSRAKQWSGFVNLKLQSHLVSAYVLTEDGRDLMPLKSQMK